MRLSNFYSLCLGAALSLALAASANATIVGSTYDFAGSATSPTEISVNSPGNGTYMDPSNPGFCIGSTTVGPNCGGGSGLTGSFGFANVSPGYDTITFTFYGSTYGATAPFTIALGNFHTTDGSTVTGVSYASGDLNAGHFTSVSWNGTTASFTSSSGDFSAVAAGNSVTFNVTTSAVPEPATVALLGLGLVGLGFSRRKKA